MRLQHYGFPIAVLCSQFSAAASPYDTEVMYKVTCTPRIELFDVDRFVVDYDIGGEFIDSEIRIANANPRIGIFRLDTGGVRTHRCNLGKGRELSLIGRGQVFDLKVNERYVFQNYFIDPSQPGAGDNVFSRITVSPDFPDSLEICAAAFQCYRLDLGVGPR